MTLTKAIELNRDLAAGIDREELQDHYDAILLGIEALTRLLTLRIEPHILPGDPLPSEDMP